MSPGTILAAGTVAGWESLITLAVGAAILFRASNAFSALRSCTTPMIAFRRTMAPMTAASSTSPNTADTAADANRSSTRNSLNWPRNCCSRVGLGASARALGPYVRSLLSASSDERPRPLLTPNPCRICPGSSECQRFILLSDSLNKDPPLATT